MATKMKQTLKNKILQIQNHQDGLAFYESLSIKQIKEMLIRCIDNCNENDHYQKLRKMELTTMSIEDIFPECIMESCILSFLIFEGNILLVSKRFNKLAMKNMYLHLKKRIKIMEVCFIYFTYILLVVVAFFC